MTISIPEGYDDLLHEPIYASLGTIRPDETVQVNPMWFVFDGEHLRFTHTTKRAKYRNLQHNPSMSVALIDPHNPLRYLEVRGKLVDVVADPLGEFYVELAVRYGMPDPEAPADSPDRVILVMSVEQTSRQ
jgi:PPOX class probable F420-dependent enzyme